MLWSAGANRGEPSAMPADHSLGFHDDQDVSPARPTVAKRGPEESVQAVQFWPWPFPFEHGDLLSEGEDFEGGDALAGCLTTGDGAEG